MRDLEMTNGASVAPDRILTNGVLAMPDMLYGKVLQGGLGIGELSRKILEHSSVEKLVTVEIDPEIISAFGNDDPRHEIVEGDFRDFDWEGFQFVVSDIPNGDHGWLHTDGWEVALCRRSG